MMDTPTACPAAAPEVTVLAVDLGKTRCRVRLHIPTKEPPGFVEADGPGSVGLAEPGGSQAAVHAIDETLQRLDRPLPPRAVACVGAAGYSPGGTTAGLAGDLVRRLGLSACAVTSDAITSHVGALAGKPGVVLSAGTGTVAIAVTAAGAVKMVDGVGQWLGDEGSGSWIGLEALRAALRALDGRGTDTILVRAARERFGDLSHLPATLSADGNVPQTAAAFAPDVLTCAAEDTVATDIIQRAAAALARTAVAASAAVPGGPVAVVGGLTRCGSTLWEPWRHALRTEHLDVVDAQGTSLDGACALALRTDLPHESHVTRHVPDPDPSRQHGAGRH